MVRAAVDWSHVSLVVFDVDGTLYAQKRLRLRMARELLVNAIKRADWRTPAILGSYRRIREELADAETAEFDANLMQRVAHRHGVAVSVVRDTVSEWIEQRPLPALARYRYPNVDDIFARIRHSGRKLGILSDYPARAKLQSLGLQADIVVSAADAGLLKPHPAGLKRLMSIASVLPEQTVMIGDRADRDGAAAARAGVICLLRSTKPIKGMMTFAGFDEPVFNGLEVSPVLAPAA